MIVPRTTSVTSSPQSITTGWPSIPALTTVFTPPASCSDLPFTYTDSGFWRDAALSRTECYPPLYLPPPNWNEYSPGVCPAKYTPNIVSIFTYTNEQVETYAFCCPYSMELITTVETTSTADSLRPYTTFQCGQIISTPTWYIHGSQTVSTSGGFFTGLASGLWVEWEKRDLSLFKPASAPILGLEHFAGTTTSPATRTATNSSNEGSSGKPGLSTGAKAGIGVSAGIVFLFLLGVALWYTRRLHQRKQRPSDVAVGKPRAELDPKADIMEAPDLAKRHEAAGSIIYEKRVEPEAVELDGHWHGHEVEDTSGKSEKDSPSRSSSIVATPAHFLRPNNWL